MSNKKIWEEYGLTEEGIRMAEAMMPEVLDMAKRYDPLALEVVLKEAVFQVHVLPIRTKAFQKKRAWRAPK